MRVFVHACPALVFCREVHGLGHDLMGRRIGCCKMQRAESIGQDQLGRRKVQSIGHDLVSRRIERRKVQRTEGIGHDLLSRRKVEQGIGHALLEGRIFVWCPELSRADCSLHVRGAGNQVYFRDALVQTCCGVVDRTMQKV